MSLRETLEQMGRSDKETAQKVRETLKQWREVAIPGLFEQVKEMLSDLIVDGLITVAPLRAEPRSEQLTGPYSIDVLDLGIRGRTITFSPVARYVVGSAGRVDLFARGGLGARYLLLRAVDDATGKDHWGIVSEKERQESKKGPRFPGRLPELSRSTLENAIQNLLQP